MPLFWISLAFLCGIALANALPWSGVGWMGAGLLCGTLGLAWRKLRLGERLPLFLQAALLPLQCLISKLPISLIAVLIAIFLGAARFQLAQPALQPGFIGWYNAGEAEVAPSLEVIGVIDKPPDQRDRYTNLILRVDTLQWPGEAQPRRVSGLLLARVGPETEWRYGDRLMVKGLLEQPPEDEGFSYRDYLARRGVHSYIAWAEAEFIEGGQGSPVYGRIYDLKRSAVRVIYKIYPDPEASLLAGILLGVESGIPEPVKQAFKATGTSHIIAISGFNMAIVAGLFASLFGRVLGKRGGAVAAAAGITVYTILVGANAAVVRAAIMSGSALFARQLGRRQDGLNSLAFVAALMSLVNPLIPWDVSFQLSFMATLGLVLYAQPLADWFTRQAARLVAIEKARRLAGPVGEYVLFTFAAQITTLPVLAYHFGRISLVSLLANPFILPAQPAVMIVGGLAVILGVVWLPLGRLAALLAWPFMAYTIRVVEGFARIPSGEVVLGEVALALVLMYYAALFGWTFARPQMQGWAGTVRPATALAGLSLLTVMVWRTALSAPDGRLHLHVLDVSTATVSGEAVLIQTPSGRWLLVNGGPSTSLLSDELGRRLGFAGSELDWLLVAAPGDEHVAALPRLLERFPARQVLWAGPHNASRASQNLYSELNRLDVPVLEAAAGQALDLGEGAFLRVVSTGKRGAVLLLEWKNFKALLPVGISWDDLDGLQSRPELREASVLLLANGGYALTNPPEWIEWTKPQLVLLSVASGDRRGQPSPDTLQALQGYSLLRTDLNGWIKVTTDGQQMWVEAAR
jgi:competence protein ComEC